MKSLQNVLLCLLAVSVSLVAAQGPPPTSTNGTGPLSQFKSRPDLYAPFLNISLFDESQVTPGYIFLGPYQTYQAGIYIYDNRGNLVYSGYGATGPGPSHNFHVCNVKGNDRLCYITGVQNLGYARGYALILDDEFKTVTSLQSQAGLAAFDEHEFNVVDDGRNSIHTLYNPETYDLSDYNITTDQGWIMNCYFQKLEIGTNRLLFEWSAIDYVLPMETYVLPGKSEVSGNGLQPSSAWDFFHINSVDQNADGDYLVSSRHTNTIFKVSGRDGHIIWRLGGRMSDFTFAPGLNFSFQHDARFRFENSSTTIISLFDNASNGFNQSSSFSSGKVLKIDHTNNTVSLLRSYVAPLNLISASQGNLQFLGTEPAWNAANVFTGWGENAYIAEYTNDGQMVQQGHFATTGAMNYRAFKANFTTNPTDAPALYTYSRNTTAATVYYMSWNGATKAAKWRIYASESQTGPWSVVDTVPKQGFETTYTASKHYAWSMVESLDSTGKALKNSTRATRTFVPGIKVAPACGDMECDMAKTTMSRTEAAASATSSSAANNVKRNSWAHGLGVRALIGIGAIAVA